MMDLGFQERRALVILKTGQPNLVTEEKYDQGQSRRDCIMKLGLQGVANYESRSPSRWFLLALA
jgi:hypothetical protein